MTWYADLTPFRYNALYAGDAIMNVGWLDAPHAYRRGPVTWKELAAIKHVVAKSWEPFLALGWHDCTLCPEGIRRVRHARPDDPDEFLGIANLFVPDPSRELLYVAPDLVLHYIEAHRYQPPRAFLDAVLACDPDSADYAAKCKRIWEAGRGRS